MTIRSTAALAALLIAASACGIGGGTEHDVTLSAGADGSNTAEWPLEVEMAASETLSIEPAGDVRDDAGHFHLMLDTECVSVGDAIPNDANHRHFGDGSTTATLAELEPGEHELCLQVGDGAHEALDATDTITVEIGEVTEGAWRDEVSRRCREVQPEIDVLFDEFFGKWESEMGAGAGPDHPDADTILADWYTATDAVTPIYQESLTTMLALPAPESMTNVIAEITSAVETSFATIAQMSVDRDPAFLWDDDAFPLDPVFQLLEENGIADCIG